MRAALAAWLGGKLIDYSMRLHRRATSPGRVGGDARPVEIAPGWHTTIQPGETWRDAEARMQARQEQP